MTKTTVHKTPPRRCGALTRQGLPCRAWAMRGSNPPRCRAHQPPAPGPSQALTASEGRPMDAPVSATPAVGRQSPAPTIDEVIADLAAKQVQLSAFIDACVAEGRDLLALVRLFALHGQNASRLGRLLRDQRALSGEAADGVRGAIAQALDELGEALETEL